MNSPRGLTKVVSVVFLTGFFLSQPAGSPAVEKAPEFSLTDLQGQHQSLSQYQGKPVVLYFWATWCPACRNEVEKMKDVYQKYHPRGVEFVSVSLDTDRAKLEKFVREKKIGYPVLFDGRGWENQVAKTYGIYSTPTFVLINPEGGIQALGSWSGDLKSYLDRI